MTTQPRRRAGTARIIIALAGLAPPVLIYRMAAGISRRDSDPAALEAGHPELASVAAQFAACDASGLW